MILNIYIYLYIFMIYDVYIYIYCQETKAVTLRPFDPNAQGLIGQRRYGLYLSETGGDLNYGMVMFIPLDHYVMHE